MGHPPRHKTGLSLLVMLPLILAGLLFAQPAAAIDSDGDTIDDSKDNCPAIANQDQKNSDIDKLGDACDDDDDNDLKLDGADNCPLIFNPGQNDADGDGLGDACDDNDDGDNFLDTEDNCPLIPNNDQADFNGNGIGDACDNSDGDIFMDDVDLCPLVTWPGNSAADDSDNDSVGDICDAFPNDGAETRDSDGDGIGDNDDNCPTTPNSDQLDSDGDLAGNVCDAFPANASEQKDSDGDGIGDISDTDRDGDGVINSSDNCPSVYNPQQKDWDKDGQGDACDSDDDNDGHPDTLDAFPHNASEWLDTDGDGIGNDADDDDDNDGKKDRFDAFPLDPKASLDTDKDGVADNYDNCPRIPNPDQEDSEGSKSGDACEEDTDNDRDNDGVKNDVDNCPLIPNPIPEGATVQTDTDNDGSGDACDEDADNDNILNEYDFAPTNPAEWRDRDGDGVGDQSDLFPDNPGEWADFDGDGTPGNAELDDDYGDNRDPDDDNDRIPDLIETRYGLDPKSAADAVGDLDGDGIDNLTEYRRGSRLDDGDNTPASVNPPQSKIIDKLGYRGARFGGAIAVSGSVLLAGNPDLEHQGSQLRGGARLYTTANGGETWTQGAGFNPSTADHQRLGKAVALASDGGSGRHVILSADGSSNAGAVLIYSEGGALLQTLTGADNGNTTHTAQGFGNALAVSGDTLVVSAPGTKPASGSGSAAGAVYVYRRSGSTWGLEAKLVGNNTAAQHFFGSSIAIDGTRIAIGATGVSNKGANSGMVYLFERSGTTWSQTTLPPLQPTATKGGDYFGNSVALKGDTLVAGAFGASDNGANSGAIYIFKLESGVWNQKARFTPADGAAQLFFGYSALITDDGQTIMAGTPFASSRTSSSSGAIYIYRFDGTTWSYKGRLQSRDRRSGDNFGHSLAYSAAINRLLAGAPGVDDNGDDAGAAYAIDLTGIGGDGDNDGIADPFDNCQIIVNSDQADLDGDGIGDLCDGDRDGDGVLNGADLFPDDPSESADTDGDGMGDKIDPDADGDGIPDRIENEAKLYDSQGNLLGELDWLDSTDADNGLPDDFYDDLDKDGATNLEEYLAGTAMNDPADKPDLLKASYRKLITDDGRLNENFGNSIAASGSYAIIGAVNGIGRDGGNNEITSGSAYIFEEVAQNQWSQTAKLKADNAANLARFGASVAILGDLALVGAPGATNGSGHTNAGAVYLFKRDGSGNWNLQTSGGLTATDDGPGPNYTGYAFGSSVAFASTTRIVVGAPGARKNSFIANSGALYVFDYDGSAWQQSAKVTGGDSKGNDAFGSSVAAAGDEIMAGAPYADARAYATGAVYRFLRDDNGNWKEQARLTASDGRNGDLFGNSLSLVSQIRTVGGIPTTFGAVAIGAPGYDGKGANSGAVYLFDHPPLSSGTPVWSERRRLEAVFNERGDTLGRSVALQLGEDGSAVLLAGAQYRDNGNSIDSGAAYLFTQAPGMAWVQQAPLIYNLNRSYDYFGSSAAITSIPRGGIPETVLLIGASGIDDNDIDAGAAFAVTYGTGDSDKDSKGLFKPDGVYDAFDNCPDHYNPNQLDSDGDQTGNACDDDDDNDKVTDANDAFPLDPNESVDTDGDGLGDAKADNDDDNDKIPDADEERLSKNQTPILDPKNSADAALDYDEDGLTNLEEFQIGTNLYDADSDSDGARDGEEIDFGSDPNKPDDKYNDLALKRPNKPLLRPILSPLPLTSRAFDSYPFVDVDNDPEDKVTDFLTQSEWQINTTPNFAKEGRALVRAIKGANSAADEEKVRGLAIPEGIMLAGRSYWIRTRHFDGTFWSEWSDAVAVTLSTEGYNYNDLGVNKEYFAHQGFDIDGDGKLDTSETEKRMITLYNAGDRAPVGLQLSHGHFELVTAVPYGDLPADLTGDGRMPYGLFSFRIAGLVADEDNPARTSITFYLPAAPEQRAEWHKYDPASHALEKITRGVIFQEKRVSVSLQDGGIYDADGIVNGVIVDPSGLYLAITDEEKLADYKTGAVSPLALLGLLLCWPLRRLGRLGRRP